jgi:predicted transglutaminase-like protease
VSDLNTHKRSILELTEDERLALVMEIRKDRYVSITRSDTYNQEVKQKRTAASKMAGAVKKLSLEQAQEMITFLQEKIASE